MQKIITEEMLDILRENVAKGLSQKRYAHTLEVEKMVCVLAELFCPDKMLDLRAAALLHDITKEYDEKVHISMLSKPGIEFTKEERLAPKTFHARTAALLIPEIYPEFADDDVVAAVRWHTTGRAGMTVAEKVLYLADYIDYSRTFQDCVKLREYFFSKDLKNMSEEELALHLDKTLIMSFDMTISAILAEGRVISPDTINARNELLVKIA